MKRLTFIILLACVGIQIGCSTTREVESPIEAIAPMEGLVSLHVAGVDRFRLTTNGAAFLEVWDAPETEALRAQTLRKLAAYFGNRFAGPNKSSPNDIAAALLPLFEDLMRTEWALEMFGPAANTPQVTLAARLDRAGAARWEGAVKRLILLADHVRPGSGEFEREAGWSLHLPSRNLTIRFIRFSVWTVIQTTPGKNFRRGALIDAIENGHKLSADDEAFFTLVADGARLGKWVSFLAGNNIDRLNLVVRGQGNGLRTEGNAILREPGQWNLGGWNIPTNTIRDPLISFTAIQGVGEWFKSRSWPEFTTTPPPNQLYFWGNDPRVPMQLFGAAPVDNGRQFIQKLAQESLPRWNAWLATNFFGEIGYSSNQGRLAWTGFPILVPYIRPAADGAFVEGGIFPISMNMFTNPPPRELLDQVTGRTNLLYYDWEITAARLLQLKPLYQLVPFVSNVRGVNTNSVSYKFIEAVGGKLGNAITEVTVESPQEVRIVRRSDIGWNGVELFALAHWLESPDFPYFGPVKFRLPERPASMPRPRR